MRSFREATWSSLRRFVVCCFPSLRPARVVSQWFGGAERTKCSGPPRGQQGKGKELTNPAREKSFANRLKFVARGRKLPRFALHRRVRICVVSQAGNSKGILLTAASLQVALGGCRSPIVFRILFNCFEASPRRLKCRRHLNFPSR